MFDKITFQEAGGIFNGSVPTEVLAFLEEADNSPQTREQIFAALRLMADARRDPRISRALAIMRMTLSPSKPFEEAFPTDTAASMLHMFATVFNAVFQDLDRQQLEVRQRIAG